MTRTKFVHSIMFNEPIIACAYDHDVESMNDDQLFVGLNYLINYVYPKADDGLSRLEMKKYYSFKRINMRPHFDRLYLLWDHFHSKRKLCFNDFDDE